MAAQAAEAHHVVLPDLGDDMEVQLERSKQQAGRQERRDVALAVLTFAAVLVLGTVLGLCLPGSRHLPTPWARISSVIGWVYMSSWSLSFYPQLYTNWRRRSVEGLSFDFLAFNFVGFVCYAVFNCTMFWSAKVRCEYSGCTGSDARAVDLNDVAFSLHAVAITGLTILQCFMYDRGGQRLARYNGAIIAVLTVGLAGLAASVAIFGEHKPLTWLTVVYVFSFVKMGITFVKYIPQVLLNCQRRSTVGWSILNVLLDLTGGVLSMGQQIMKAWVLDDWSIVVGNPVKLGLAVCSLAFDGIFIVQHYVLYHPQRGYSKLATDSCLDSSILVFDALGSPQSGNSIHAPAKVDAPQLLEAVGPLQSPRHLLQQ